MILGITINIISSATTNKIHQNAFEIRSTTLNHQFWTPIIMVYGTQITIVTGAFVNQLITGGPHIV